MKRKIILVCSPTAMTTYDLWRPQPELPVLAVCGDQVLLRVVDNANHILLMDLWSREGDREQDIDKDREGDRERDGQERNVTHS